MILDKTSCQCFIVLAETASFTKTAERVGRTQSAVSQQIAKLEKIIDNKLINRGKSISLTHEGELFLSYVRKIYSLQCEAIDRFKEPDLQGEVRFGLPEDFAAVFLSDVLVDFVQIHPRVTLTVECDLTLNLFERFKSNQFDLILVKMSKPSDFPECAEIWSEKLVWVAHPDYKLDDTMIDLVLSPQPCVYRSRAIKALDYHKQSWRIALSTHSFSGLIAAVKAKVGISVLPKNMIPKGLAVIGECQQLPCLDDTHISMIKHNRNNAAINSFENFVLEKLRTY